MSSAPKQALDEAYAAHRAWIAQKRSDILSGPPTAAAAYRIVVIKHAIWGANDIVSSLTRALCNLGHHVLDVPSLHTPGLLDDSDHATPGNLKSGHGPRWINLGPINRMINEFRPHIILLMAGGLAFRPADAQKLKEKGIILIGLTLSDPDVLPSMADHVGVLDLHTTNAQAAMDLYQGRGIGNTVYFPFGIDLSYICAPLRHKPELEADAICLGNGRPERNRTMVAIGRTLNQGASLRCYGKNWDFPGSTVVRGRKMMQASRAGKIHVNFPGTVAGNTNVKCGVFESIGSGAAVLTLDFAEIQDFFVPDKEIITAASLDDFPAVVADMLQNPQRLFSIARSGFERLLSAHSYERRWESLFEQMRAGHVFAGHSEDRESQIKQILSNPVPPAMPVVVSGFYGAGNLGDELILRSIRRNFSQRNPALLPVAVGQRKNIIRDNHGMPAFDRRDFAACDDMVRASAAFILGGGGLWNDYTFESVGGIRGLYNNCERSIGGFANLGLMAYHRKVPFHVFGMGVGPLSDPEAKELIAHICAHTRSVRVRDRQSFDILKDIVPDSAMIGESVDLVYGLQLPHARNKRTDQTTIRILVNIRPWFEDRGKEEDWLKEIAAGLALFKEKASKPVRLIGAPLQAGGKDKRLLNRLFETLGVPMENQEWIDPGARLVDGLKAIGQCDAFLSMRLHGCLLAHRYRRPAVGLVYDPKVKRHFQEVKREHYALPLETNRDGLANALLKAIEEGIAPVTEAALTRLEKRAQDDFDALVRDIEQYHKPRGLWPIPSEQVPTDNYRGSMRYAVRKAGEL